MSESVVAVSAPGKVLFAGGFLVLDRKHTGLVFGLNARIHVHVEKWTRGLSTKTSSKYILVCSPQFEDANWCYSWDNSDGEGGVKSSTPLQQVQEYVLTSVEMGLSSGSGQF